MDISKEDDKSSWEQYHIIPLSHIVLYWIWSSLDSNESLLVTGNSPSIFGLQHCCCFRKRMQLNMGGLRFNTLFLYYLFHNHLLYFFFFFFNFPFFCSLYFFFFYFLLQRMLILLGLSWCHKFQLHVMSLMPQIKGTFIKIECFKIKPCHLKTRWQQFKGAISHNTSFTHCPVLTLILAWFEWKLVGNWSFSNNLWPTTLLLLL